MGRLLVKEWREFRGLTRDELLDRLRENGTPVPESTFKKIELGKTARPQRETVAAIAKVLETTEASLEKKPSASIVQEHSAELADEEQLGRLPRMDSRPWLDDWNLSDEEKQVRLANWQDCDEFWRSVLDMNDRIGADRYDDIQRGSLSSVGRKTMVEGISGAVPLVPLEALLFAGVVWATFQAIDAASLDHTTYDAWRGRMHRIVDDAIRVGELVWLSDEYAGATIGGKLMRDTDAAGLRAYRSSVEAWERTFAPRLLAWAGVGPQWDEDGTRNLLGERAMSFEAFDGLFGARLAKVLDERNVQG